MQIPPANEVEAELLRRDFAYFCKQAWPQIDPAPLVWSWHLDALCLHLQAVAEGRIKQLVICVPPGHAKSLIVSVLYPAWVWARTPQHKFIASSYASALSMRDAVRCRALLTSDWFRDTFRQQWELKEDQNTKGLFANTAGGERLSIGVDGTITGFRCDTLIIDDPLKAADAHSALEREKVIRWKNETMSTRFNDMSTKSEILIMQRLHENDLAGHLIEHENWVVLELPTLFDPARRCVTPIWSDPRTHDGELLFPQRFPQSVVDSLQKSLGSYAWSAQHQQRPSPASGLMIKRHWLQRRHGVGLLGTDCVSTPQRFDASCIAVDCSFKDNPANDKVAIGVYAKAGADLYMLHLTCRVMGFSETVQAIIDVRSKFPWVRTTLIEDKANGSAVIDVLKKRVPGIIPVTPNGGKESRVASITTYLEAGNLILPVEGDWVLDFVEECVSFPKGKNDDALDATTYAMLRLFSQHDNVERFKLLGAK